jgi:hypothetical protein
MDDARAACFQRGQDRINTSAEAVDDSHARDDHSFRHLRVRAPTE